MSKYEKFSKEELLALVEKQYSELASKKYGLVWDSEREPEQVVLDCEHNVPVLKRVKGKEIKESKDQEDNILIEGDNYHALTVLNYTHQEKIDVIYIDPPYNTGNKDFKYNDKFVDKEDGFRHSKWLNFMEKRLKLTKELLADNGVIYISIDDNEAAQLKLLLDKLLNHIGTIHWRRTEGQDNLTKNISVVAEYILVYGKKKKESYIFNKLLLTDRAIKEYRYEDEFGKFRRKTLVDKQRGKHIFNIKTPGGEIINGPFNISEEKFKLIPKKDIYWADGKMPYLKTYLTSSSGSYPNNWFDNSFGTNEDGTDDLTKILGRSKFDHPKPTSLIETLLSMAPQNDFVLDFFAGSGTTGHAVLNLNKDGQNRKFILCTNNENKICEEVTYPRIQKVIKGYKKNGNGEKVVGLGGNLQYFKTELIKKTKNKDQLRFDLTQKCTEMLCVKENIFNLKTQKEDYKIFSSNKADKFLCVYYNLYDESFSEFIKEIKKLKGEKKIYVFSIDGKADRSLFKGINDFEIEEIPQKIIDIYKQLVKMNIPVKVDTIFMDFEKAQKKVFEEQDKDEGARILRIVLEKTIQKITQQNKMSIFKENNKEEKIAILNDNLYNSKILKKVQWEENKTYLAIGNHASHGEYSEYDLKQVENFYKHIQSLFNDFGI